MNEHEETFAAFAAAHAKYALNKQKWQEEFDREGEKVREIIHEWETRLCGKQERGKNAVFSSKLAEKFWDEIRAFFPLIDFVGVKVKVAPVKNVAVSPTPAVTGAGEADPDLAEIDAMDEEFDIPKLL